MLDRRLLLAKDPYTSLLLHLDGANNATVFTDSSAHKQTVTRGGNTIISTAQSKFGGAAGYFDGSDSYLSVPDNAIYAFGAGDFTIDVWIRLTAKNHSGFMVSQYYTQSSDAAFRIYTAVSYLAFGYSLNGTSWTTISGLVDNVALNTWYHVAVVRYGATITLYIDGMAARTSNIGSDSIHNSSEPIIIGGANSEGGVVHPDTIHHGYLDEFRISKGIARWTADFTPPAKAYKS